MVLDSSDTTLASRQTVTRLQVRVGTHRRRVVRERRAVLIVSVVVVVVGLLLVVGAWVVLTLVVLVVVVAVVGITRVALTVGKVLHRIGATGHSNCGESLF